MKRKTLFTLWVWCAFFLLACMLPLYWLGWLPLFAVLLLCLGIVSLTVFALQWQVSEWLKERVGLLHQVFEHSGEAVMITDPGNRILSRQLLYTGVSRARQSLELWGARGALDTALATPIHRTGALAQRLA